MQISKSKLFFSQYIFEFLLFIFFLIYFFVWLKFNYTSVNVNNNDLDTAVKLFNYKPYLSFFINNLIFSNTIKIFLGYCFFPSLVSVIIFMIFNKS